MSDTTTTDPVQLRAPTGRAHYIAATGRYYATGDDGLVVPPGVDAHDADELRRAGYLPPEDSRTAAQRRKQADSVPATTDGQAVTVPAIAATVGGAPSVTATVAKAAGA